jgi:hypothetical protein
MAPFYYFYIFIFSGMGKNKKALRIQKGIEHPPNVNPDVLSGKGNRKQQAVLRMNDAIMEYLNKSFHDDENVKRAKPQLERLLQKGKITSYRAAVYLIDKYFKR